jgi:hypothetical protein
VPATPPTNHERSPATAGDQGVDKLIDEDLVDDEDPDENPEAVHELHDALAADIASRHTD